MVNAFANVYMNINQVYMAGLMAAPMGIIELALMGAMYRDRKIEHDRDRRQRHSAGRLLGVTQTANGRIGQAILAIDDPASRGGNPDVRRGAHTGRRDSSAVRSIISSQQSEIDQMKAKLSVLDR
jgi:hypothetical protein